MPHGGLIMFLSLVFTCNITCSFWETILIYIQLCIWFRLRFRRQIIDMMSHEPKLEQQEHLVSIAKVIPSCNCFVQVHRFCEHSIPTRVPYAAMSSECHSCWHHLCCKSCLNTQQSPHIGFKVCSGGSCIRWLCIRSISLTQPACSGQWVLKLSFGEYWHTNCNNSTILSEDILIKSYQPSQTCKISTNTVLSN